ncbi:MAG: xanthine dehydrogenase family protein subunit M [Desulfomonilaceae bacterium]|nr:xanthine dehydrogenase family protein subunit M [Desulfomonilaceae bacterium]
MRLPKFAYFAPRTVEEALNLLADHGEGARVMAGGTDVMVKMIHGLLKPTAIISLLEIEELRGIHFDAKDGLTIGATAPLADTASHPDIVKYYPALVHAIRSMANVEVRNMGTVAGNICNAAPSADTAPPLMVMNGEVNLASLKGQRRLSLNEFFRGPGVTNMIHGEILTSIHVPPPLPKSGVSYQRISARCGVDIAAVGVGVGIVLAGEACKDAKIVLGAVAPVPMRALETEELVQGRERAQELLGQAGDRAAQEARPISDMRASASWRRKMTAVLTRRALDEAFERASRR